MALSNVFLTSPAMRFWLNSRSASAVDTFLPRISCATRLSFCGETRRLRATALAALSSSARGADFLPILPSLRRRRRRRPARRLLVAGVTVEGARRRELAELVADHLLGDEDRDVLVAVVHAERDADELRQDGRAPAPDLDDLRAPRAARSLGLLQEIAVDERALP